MPEKRQKELSFKLGDMVISILSTEGSLRRIKNNDPWWYFRVNQGRPDVVLQMHYGEIPDYELKEPIFNSQGFWKVFRNNGEWVFWLYGGRDLAPLPAKLIVFERNFKSGVIYINSSHSTHYPAMPLDYPLDIILSATLISLRDGMLLHSCGINDQGKGLLFIGPSGSGKSTLANLWKDKKGVTILSDEFIILRKKGKTFWIYGTPWSGTAQTFSPESVPLKKIFFIRPERKNTLVFKKGIEIAASLLSQPLFPSWDRAGIESVLGLCEDLNQRIPCYELGFVPKASVLHFIRGKA